MPSCSDVKSELIECMQKTPCMAELGYPFKKCFEPENQIYVTKECQALTKAYGACKRSLLNMRYRFRGIKAGNNN